MYCIFCGEKISESAQFCPHCGKNLSTNAPQENKKKTVTIFSIIIALIIIGCIIFIVFVLPGRGGNKYIKDETVLENEEPSLEKKAEDESSSEIVREKDDGKSDSDNSDKNISEGKNDKNENASEKDDLSSILDSYQKYINNNWGKLYFYDGESDTPVILKNDQFFGCALFYLNNDDVPECYYATWNKSDSEWDEAYNYTILTYNDGDVKSFSFEQMPGMLHTVGYGERTGYLVTIDGGNFNPSFYEMDKAGNITLIARLQHTYAPEGYYIDDKEVTEKEYIEYLDRFGSLDSEFPARSNTIDNAYKVLKSTGTPDYTKGFQPGKEAAISKKGYYYFEPYDASHYARIKNGKLEVYGKLKKTRNLNDADFIKTLKLKKRTYKLEKGYILDYCDGASSDTGKYPSLSVSQFNNVFYDGGGEAAFCIKVDKNGKVSHIRCFS